MAIMKKHENEEKKHRKKKKGSVWGNQKEYFKCVLYIYFCEIKYNKIHIIRRKGKINFYRKNEMKIKIK